MVWTAPCIFKKKLLRWLVGLQVEAVASQHSLQLEEEVGDGGWSVCRLKKKLMKLLAEEVEEEVGEVTSSLQVEEEVGEVTSSLQVEEEVGEVTSSLQVEEEVIEVAGRLKVEEKVGDVAD
jgi:hypothetical protein